MVTSPPHFVAPNVQKIGLARKRISVCVTKLQLKLHNLTDGGITLCLLCRRIGADERDLATKQIGDTAK